MGVIHLYPGPPCGQRSTPMGQAIARPVRAVTVTYRPGNHRGTGVDTFTAAYVTRRAVQDPTLDGPGTPRSRTAFGNPV